ncbi:MAG TPA: hypothetical protein VM369_06455 [Candidatus Binatia bacterium]|nr:hypothetical protein [Candidatus Binatia bacterium]
MKNSMAGCLLLAALAAPAAALAVDAPRPAPRALSYRWVEADYAFNYFGQGNLRLSSDAGFRLSTNLRLAPHFYLVGSYDYQDYPGPEFKFGSAGIGSWVSFAPALDGFLNLTWETENLDGDSANGWGAQVGLRTLVTRFGEIQLGYKYAEYDDTAFRDRDMTVHGMLTLPLARALDLTMRFEHTDKRETVKGGSGDVDVDFENLLVGFRVRF